MKMPLPPKRRARAAYHRLITSRLELCSLPVARDRGGPAGRVEDTISWRRDTRAIEASLRLAA